jgi:nucleotide-binding universal stress UspA family protein
MLPANEDERLGRARPSLRVRGVDWPLFAIVGGAATAVSFVVILVQNEATRWTGAGWILAGLVGYVLYRRFAIGASPRTTVKAPPAFGPALALEYRRLLVPVLPGRASDDALDVAASLAAERGAHIAAVTVLEIPLELPLDTELPVEERYANRELDEARAIGASYGISVIPRLLRSRSAGAAIVEEAARRGSEIIVIGAPRKDVGRRKRAVFGGTVDYVLKHAPCRVMVTALREAT